MSKITTPAGARRFLTRVMRRLAFTCKPDAWYVAVRILHECRFLCEIEEKQAKLDKKTQL